MVIICGHCGVTVEPAVIAQSPGPRGVIDFVRCPSCGEGTVLASNGIAYPSAPAGVLVPNLPPDVEVAWREARSAHAVAAYTAAEIMCRKILMHLAVDVVKSGSGKNFSQYVTDLDDAGFVAPGLRAVVDQIRQRGNAANHELPASTEQESLTTMAITEHLLRTIYELPGLVPSLPSQ